MIMESGVQINQISQTAFLTLQCHAMDAQSKHPVLNDRSSLQTLEKLKASIMTSDTALHRRIRGDKVRKSLVDYTVRRARKYDDSIRDYLGRYPDATVINIGCGLDDRFSRIDNGSVTFYDLDLPDIMNIKKELFPQQERYFHISQSVFAFDWMDRIYGAHVMLAAEGVFMYCEERDVKLLFRGLQSRFRDPEIIFEVFNKKWLTGWRKKAMEIKMMKELKCGEGALFKSGIADSDEIETWHEGYRLLEEWSYFDDHKNSLLLKLFRHMDAVRKVQWTVRYVLGR